MAYDPEKLKVLKGPDSTLPPGHISRPRVADQQDNEHNPLMPAVEAKEKLPSMIADVIGDPVYIDEVETVIKMHKRLHLG